MELDTTPEMQDLTNTWQLSQILQLPPEPLVVIVGAYGGKLMEWFLRHYPGATVVGYEPQDWAYIEAVTRLNNYDANHTHTSKWELHLYGLGTKSESLPMYNVGTDACTFCSTGDKSVYTAEIREATKELISLIERYARPIDLMVMNIEGYEYQLLPHIIPDIPSPMRNVSYATPYAVKSLAVQFHTVAEPSPAVYSSILFDLNNLYPHHFNEFLPSWGYWY